MGVAAMASVAFSAKYVLPIRGRNVRLATKAQSTRAGQWPLPAIADAASGVVFLGALGWAVWRIAAQYVQIAGAFESQVAASGMGGLF
jgi:hypothetical protein